MSADDTGEQLAAIARAEFAAWKKDPVPRRAAIDERRPRRALLAAPAGLCGTGPASPETLKALLDALTLQAVRANADGAVPTRIPVTMIQQLIARGDVPEERIARVAGVAVEDVRSVQADMDELAAS